MLCKLDTGMRIGAVGRHYGVNELTIRVIKKCEDRIRGSVKASAPSSAKISYLWRHGTFKETWKWPASTECLAGPEYSEHVRNINEDENCLTTASY